jgi:membrane protein implicated in regulation of membrane protease activity
MRCAGPLALSLMRALLRTQLFSRAWWLTMSAATLIFAAATLLILTSSGSFEWGQLLLYLILITLVGDVITAVSMEAVVPTRIAIGPGDRKLDRDLPQERGELIAMADEEGLCRVRIHGETWRARLTAAREPSPAIGSRVRVIDRKGLTLLVTPAED